MRYFPVFIDVKGRKVAVIGGGEEALRKVRLLLKTEALIEVIAPILHQELADHAEAGRIAWTARAFAPSLIDGARLVYAAEPALNDAIAAAAHARGILVNAVDEAGLSSFIMPSIVDRDPLVVAIGTEGAAPMLALGIRARIEAMLPLGLGALAAAGRDLRAKVARAVPQGRRRRGFWQRFFFSAPAAAFLAGDRPAFLHAVAAALSDASAPALGRVAFVGAGPGDPELLTLRGQRKLQEADIIVHDRRIDPGILELARRDAVRIANGGAPGGSEIIAALIRAARAGKEVVRLVGGDAAVSGPAGAEQTALAAAGVPVDVIPGVAAAPARPSAEVLPFPVPRPSELKAAS